MSQADGFPATSSYQGGHARKSAIRAARNRCIWQGPPTPLSLKTAAPWSSRTSWQHPLCPQRLSPLPATHSSHPPQRFCILFFSKAPSQRRCISRQTAAVHANLLQCKAHRLL